MDRAEKLGILSNLIGSDVELSGTECQFYLDAAGDKIIQKAFPFGGADLEVPSKYSRLQIEIAVYLINKRGAEGQTSHAEGVVTRKYESSDVPASMLSGVIPQVKV